MTRNTAAYEPGYLARFTASITSAVPQFDLATNPIGHALAMEMFAPEAGLETTAIPVVVPEIVPAGPAARPVEERKFVTWPELAIEARARALAERARALAEITGAHVEPVTEDDDIFGDIVELPTAASEVEWFEATTEPDEELDEADEQVRMAG
jgi:hypothetical protein